MLSRKSPKWNKCNTGYWKLSLHERLPGNSVTSYEVKFTKLQTRRGHEEGKCLSSSCNGMPRYWSLGTWRERESIIIKIWKSDSEFPNFSYDAEKFFCCRRHVFSLSLPWSPMYPRKANVSIVRSVSYYWFVYGSDLYFTWYGVFLPAAVWYFIILKT